MTIKEKLQFDKLKRIFNFKDIAVVGMSPKHDRPSNKVGQYLYDMGFNVVAVNPTTEKYWLYHIISLPIGYSSLNRYC